MCETAFRFFKIKRSVERGEHVFGAPLGVTGLKCGSKGRRAGVDTRPYSGYRDGPVLLVGAGLGPARGRTLCAPTADVPPGLYFKHWPTRGLGDRKGRPYGGKRIGSVG